MKIWFGSIRGRIDSDWFGFICIVASDWIGLGQIDFYHFSSNELQKIFRIGSDTDIGMYRNSSDCLGMNCYPILSPRVTKCFSDWFGTTRIDSDKNIGMKRNSSDWLGMNSYPILSPGILRCSRVFRRINFKKIAYTVKEVKVESRVYEIYTNKHSKFLLLSKWMPKRYFTLYCIILCMQIKKEKNIQCEKLLKSF